jgi:excinuclease UvrABC helicase subunit UvrB
LSVFYFGTVLVKKNRNKLKKKNNMFGNEDFEKLFNQILSKSFLLNPDNFEKNTYMSEDGNMSFTYITTKGHRQDGSDELSRLKQKLDLAVEEQKFEDAVVLRDKIKNLEENVEKINDLNKELTHCIKTQDFERAIEVRDKINSLK